MSKSVVDFDTYGHLYFAKAVQQNKSLPWGKVEMNLWEGKEWRHPFLWHWIVAKFSIEKVLHYQKWINPIIDSVFAFAFYILLLFLDFSLFYSLCGMLVYLLTPMWFSRISIGPRIQSLTPRLISEIFFNVLLVVYLVDLNLSLQIKLLLGILISLIILLTSKFGVQVLLLLIPLISLFTLDAVPLISLLLALVVAIIISKGEVLLMFKEQYLHLKNYYIGNRKRKFFISNRNNLKSIFNKLKDIRAYKVEIIWNLVAINSYTSVLLKMPILFINLTFVFLILLHKYGFEKLSVHELYLSPLFASLIIFFITNSQRFLFLGEAERYLNHISIILVINFITVTSQLNLFWANIAIVTYGVVYLLFELLLVDKYLPQLKRSNPDDELERYLLSRTKVYTIVNFPYHAFGVFRIMLKTKHKVVYPLFSEEEAKLNFINEFEDKYPFINLNKLNEISNKTACDLLIINNKAKKDSEYSNWIVPPNWVKIELNYNTYDVYERVI